MRVLFFYPKIESSFRPSYAPLGIMSIATYLNANGHSAVICDRFFSNESIKNLLDKNKPDIVGVSVISQIFIKDAKKVSEAVKKAGIPVVWGGSAASSIAQTALESGCVDYVSFSEGEATWLEMANNFDKGISFDEINGIGYIKNGEYIKTQQREFLDLSVLPMLDWTLVDPKNYMQKAYGFNKMLSTYYSRGCGGHCAYCYNVSFHRSKRRCRKLDVLIEEMHYLSENFGADGFDFSDEVMFTNKGEAIEFCNAILESGVNVNWSGYLSVGIVNDIDVYELMYRAGCRALIYGIESASEKILSSVNKVVRLDKAKDNVEKCLSVGIVPIAAFIIGFPGETEEDVLETITFSKELKGAAICYNFFTALPGTEVYECLVKAKKIIPLKDLKGYERINELESLSYNFSEIPTKELYVIKNYIRLRGILCSTGSSDDEQFIKVVKNTIKSWTGRGVIHFFRGVYNTVYNLVNTFSVFLHPKIRKKYDLYFIK